MLHRAPQRAHPNEIVGVASSARRSQARAVPRATRDRRAVFCTSWDRREQGKNELFDNGRAGRDASKRKATIVRIGDAEMAIGREDVKHLGRLSARTSTTPTAVRASSSEKEERSDRDVEDWA